MIRMKMFVKGWGEVRKPKGCIHGGWQSAAFSFYSVSALTGDIAIQIPDLVKRSFKLVGKVEENTGLTT